MFLIFLRKLLKTLKNKMASIAYITEKVWIEHRDILLKDLESKLHFT